MEDGLENREYLFIGCPNNSLEADKFIKELS